MLAGLAGSVLVVGDGSRLLGYGDVAESTPVTCQGSSSLELVRQ